MCSHPSNRRPKPRQADAVLELGHGARRNVRFLRGDEKTRFDFGEGRGQLFKVGELGDSVRRVGCFCVFFFFCEMYFMQISCLYCILCIYI